MFHMPPEEDELQMRAEQIVNTIVSEEKTMSHHLQAPENNINVAHFEQAVPFVNYAQHPSEAKRFRLCYNSVSDTRRDYDHLVTQQKYKHHFGGRNYNKQFHPEANIECPSFQTYNRAHVKSDNNPTVELHYLEGTTDYPQFVNSGIGRSFLQKSAGYNQEVKRNYIYKSNEDYNKIVVDLSHRGVTNNGKTSRPVQRLFSRFCKLYNAMGEVSHSIKTYTYSAYEPTFAPKPKSFNLRTLNVRSQVEFASLKLNAFFSILLQVVTQNRMYDQILIAEFDRYLNDLQSLVSQFETFKGLEFKHERGEFVGINIRDAQRLITLLEKLTTLLNEVNLRLIVYDWYTAFKPIDDSDVQQMETLNTETVGSGNSGIVNETLRMSDTTTKPAPAQTGRVDIGATYANPISRDEQIADGVFKIEFLETIRPPIPSTSEQVSRHKYVQSGAFAKHNHVISHAQQQQQQHLGGEHHNHPNNLAYHSVPPVAGQSFLMHAFGRTPDQFQNDPTLESHYPKRPKDTANLHLYSDSSNGRSFCHKSAGNFQEGQRYSIENIYKTKQDYDKIVVDLSAPGVTTNGNTTSPVQRLFSRFRKLHNAMGEVAHSIKTYTYSAYEFTFAPIPKTFRLGTLSVRSQLEFASLKLNAFFSVLLQVVKQNRMYDQKLNAEFDRYLLDLQSMVFQLDTFKGLKMKHVRGEFVGMDVPAHVEHLIALLEKLIELLSEFHLRVIVYDWYTELQSHQDSGVRQMEPQNTQTDGRGGIGIVNEILCGMCNTTLTVPETGQTATNYIDRNDFIFNGKDVDDF